MPLRHSATPPPPRSWTLCLHRLLALTHWNMKKSRKTQKPNSRRYTTLFFPDLSLPENALMVPWDGWLPRIPTSEIASEVHPTAELQSRCRILALGLIDRSRTFKMYQHPKKELTLLSNHSGNIIRILTP